MFKLREKIAFFLTVRNLAPSHAHSQHTENPTSFSQKCSAHVIQGSCPSSMASPSDQYSRFFLDRDAHIMGLHKAQNENTWQLQDGNKNTLKNWRKESLKGEKKHRRLNFI
jgi:hypothetical protein